MFKYREYRMKSKTMKKHIKKDMQEEKEIMHEAQEIRKAAKKMQKEDKNSLRSMLKSGKPLNGKVKRK